MLATQNCAKLSSLDLPDRPQSKNLPESNNHQIAPNLKSKI